MALQHTVTSSNLTDSTLTDCYLKITEIRLSKPDTDIAIKIYLSYWLSATDKTNGKSPYQTLRFDTSAPVAQFDNVNILDKAYTYLKSLSEFTGATDV